MAGKRSATTELNHENWDQEDDESEVAGHFVQADADELSKRVFKKAKRRGAAPPKTDGPGIFSAFGGFGTKPASGAGSFDFLAKNTNGSSPSASTGFAFGSAPSAEPPKASFSFGSAAAPSSIFGQSGNDSTPKATFSFGSKPAQNDDDDDVVQVEEDTEPKPSSGFDFSGLKKQDGAAKKWNCPACCVPNEDDKDKCVCCETAKPGAAKEPAASVAAAAAPPAVATKSGGFDFSGLSKSQTTKKWSCSECFASNDDDKDACACCEHPKPGAKKKDPPPAATTGGFKFGSSDGKSSSGFSFGSSTAAPAATPSAGFQFGASSEKKEATAGFSFGSKTVPEKAPTAAAATESKDAEPNKDFLVNLGALNKQFAKWISQHVDKDPYVDLSPCLKDYFKHLDDLKAKNKDVKPSEEKKEEPKLLGAFFGGPKADASPPKPVTFGAKVESKGFAFGSTKEPEKPAAEKPAVGGFSLGKTEMKAFSFGSNGTEAKEPAAAAAAPSFSFGSKTAAGPVAGGFSFGAASGSSMFAGAAASAVAGATANDAKEEEGEDQPPKVEITQVVEEDSIHSVRCKLFYKKGKEFLDKGLGMLHLKKVEDKIQMVVRAETNLGNILLNVLLKSEMNFVRRANNLQFSCLPNPPIKGMEDGPVVMLVKVKNADLASILEEEINKLV